MYSLGITVHIKPEHVAEFIEFTREIVVQSRLEPGCLWFDLLRSEHDPSIFTSYEAYRSEADYQEHLRQPYIRAWLERARPLMAAGGVIYPSHTNLYPNNPER
ncbi:MAG: putative quinol monooxygenase [bacterium]|nr:putative quinol monooxygenase [bacterium]